jgi:serine/threonine protein kinase
MRKTNDSVSAIYLAASARNNDRERAAYLESACAGDAALRERVERLLRAGAPPADGNDFLESPISELCLTETQTVAEKAGGMVGEYKLIEQIGEGGFGVVFRAEQVSPVRRQVALKVIKPGMDTKQVIARFEAERQALAMMDHPNIARVLDAGATDSGRPYFVMELVRGVPITEFCDANQLGTRERLGLFVDVCRAVQHAHQKGVIHRDLKPSNVLVTMHDDRPVPKVIDFGIAKATQTRLTEQTLFTAFRQFVGTPQYTSPEQAQMSGLDVDTRSDIYSLGVLLYELLTGTTPLDPKALSGAAFDRIQQMIREAQPPRPSTRLSTMGAPLTTVAARRGADPKKLPRTIRGELDWIVMRCLEKDRTRRYDTATGLWRDVRRYLDGEPVEASPPSAAYRLRVLAKKHRRPIAVAVFAAALMVAATAVSTWQAFRATRARAVAQQNLRRAEQAESETLDAYRSGTDEAVERLITSRPVMGPQERAYLESTLKRWQALASRGGQDERSQAIRGEGHYRVGRLWSQLGRNDEARANLVEALRVQEHLAEQFPENPAHRFAAVATRCLLGSTLLSLHLGDGLAEYRKARDSCQSLVARYPHNLEYQLELCKICSNLGLRGIEVQNLEAAIETAQKLVNLSPSRAEFQQVLADSRLNLGAVLADHLHRPAEALAQFEAVLRIRQGLAAQFPEDIVQEHAIARVQLNVGIVQSELGQSDNARVSYTQARDRFQVLVEQFPGAAGYREDLAHIRRSLAILLDGAFRDRDAARKEFEGARDLYQVLSAEFPSKPGYLRELGRTQNDLGWLLIRQRDAEGARKTLGGARDVYTTLHERFPEDTGYQQLLGRAWCGFGAYLCDIEDKPLQSLECFDRAIVLLRPVRERLPEDMPTREDLRNCHYNRSVALSRLGRQVEAIAALDSAAEFARGRELLDLRAARAAKQAAFGDTSKAVAEADELAKLEPLNGGELYNLACTYSVAAGRAEEPRRTQYADRAMALLRKSVDRGYDDLGHLRERDTDLQPLRGRADFAELVKSMTEKLNSRRGDSK